LEFKVVRVDATSVFIEPLGLLPCLPEFRAPIAPTGHSFSGTVLLAEVRSSSDRSMTGVGSAATLSSSSAKSHAPAMAPTKRKGMDMRMNLTGFHGCGWSLAVNREAHSSCTEPHEYSPLLQRNLRRNRIIRTPTLISPSQIRQVADIFPCISSLNIGYNWRIILIPTVGRPNGMAEFRYNQSGCRSPCLAYCRLAVY
jgi:hypothetical protein